MLKVIITSGLYNKTFNKLILRRGKLESFHHESPPPFSIFALKAALVPLG